MGLFGLNGLHTRISNRFLATTGDQRGEEETWRAGERVHAACGVMADGSGGRVAMRNAQCGIMRHVAVPVLVLVLAASCYFYFYCHWAATSH
jgi:hypothetical protein